MFAILRVRSIYFHCLPFIWFGRPDQSVLKWNASALRAGSGQNGPDHGSEPLSSPAPVGQSAGIWRVVAGKRTRAPSGFPFKLARTSSLGRPELTDESEP